MRNFDLVSTKVGKNQRKTKKVIPKTYPLYRMVKCGTCGRAMTYKTYSFRGEEYKYFGCPHAKEHVEIVWKFKDGVRKFIGM